MYKTKALSCFSKILPFTPTGNFIPRGSEDPQQTRLQKSIRRRRRFRRRFRPPGSKCDICHISCPDWSTNMAKIAHFPFLVQRPKCDIFHISCPDLSTIMAKIAHFRFQTSFHKMITCPVLNANMASQMPVGER